MSNRWDYEMDARKVATWVREIFGNDFVSFLSTTNQAVDSDNEIALQEHQKKCSCLQNRGYPENLEVSSLHIKHTSHNLRFRLKC
jgi:hypothetical protein